MLPGTQLLIGMLTVDCEIPSILKPHGSIKLL